MVNINPREVAADTLIEIINNGSYNNMALKQALKQNGAMDKKDKGFVTEVVNGTLRNIYYIDFIIDGFSTVKCEKLKPVIAAAVRSAVYQIFFMNVPESAAINEAVKLVKKRGFIKLSGFVNGVLRNICRNKNDIALPDKDTEPDKHLSVKYSHPLWIVKMWLSQYEFDFVEALCKKNNEPPVVCVSVNTLKTDKASLIRLFEKEGLTAEAGRGNSVSLKKLSDMSKLKSYNDGLFHVQDESSALAVRILDPKPNEKILDLCAAPGGKSLLMAEIMENKGEISSRDIFEHKIELIADSAERLGIDIIKTRVKDASVFYPEDEERFDRVLVDAPCSGLGLLRKKPDIRFRKNGNDIDSLIKLQREILTVASKYVKRGGVLVYSTCTICKKENLGNIKWFLDNNEFELSDISFISDEYACDTLKSGYIQLFPSVHGTDGFFVARMKRREQ